MAIVGSAVLELLGNSAQFRTEMTGAARHFEAIGSRLQSIGATLTKVVTVPILGIGVAAGKAFIDFESSFAGIRKTMNLTEAEFGKLAQANRNMAKTIPVSVNELNRIGELAGQLGIRGVQNVLKFEDTIAKLAVTTDLTAEQGALAFAQIANILQLPQDQIDRLGSAVVGLGNNFATTESKIVDFVQRIAGAGKIAGLSAGDVAGIGTAFASLGIEAEAGGTAVQKVLLAMVKATTQGGDELEAFARTTGLTSKAFTEAFQKDAAGAFSKFVEALGRQGNKAINTLEELGLDNERLRTSFLSAAGAGDLLSRAIARGNTEFDANNALTAEAEKRFATARSQLTIFWNRIKDVAITLGGSLVPILIKTLDAMQPLIDLAARGAEAFGKLPKPIQLTAVALAAVAAAAGPVIVALGTLTKLMPVFTAGIAVLTAPISAPILATLLAITAAITTATAGWQAWKAIVGDTRELDDAATSVDTLRKHVAKLNGELVQTRFEQLQIVQKEQAATVQQMLRRLKDLKGTAIGAQMEKDLARATAELSHTNQQLGVLRERMDQLQSIDPIVVMAGTGGVGGGGGKVSGDIQEIIKGFHTAIRTADELERQLGDAFDLPAEKAAIYRQALEDLVAENVSLNAVVGPQGERLRELGPIYTKLTAGIKAKTDAEREAARITEEGRELTKSLLTPQERYNEAVARYKELRAASIIDEETYWRAVVAATTVLYEATQVTDEATRSIEAGTQTIADALDQMASNTVSALSEFAQSGKASFKSFVNSAIADLSRLLARLIIFKTALSIFGAGPLGSLFGDSFLGFKIGTKAAGGPVMRNRAYYVGERGPELFVPSSSGKIIPNNAVSGGGNTIRLDFSHFPAASNPLAMARDDQWMNFLKESLMNAYEDGNPVLQRG